MILIAGDSWAAGEFKPKYQEMPAAQMISHGGLSQWLSQDGHQILNISAPGGSNWDSILRLFSFFITNTGAKVSKIFVFQTDWVRDVYHHSTLVSKDRIIGDMFIQPMVYDFFDPRHANEYRDIILSKFYSRLSTISQTYNVAVYLIGGLSDLLHTDTFEKKYPGLTPICQSLVSLALNNDPVVADKANITTGYIYGDSTKLIDFIKQKLSSIDQWNELMHQVDLGSTRYEILQKRTDLFPDGQHPGRDVHRTLYNLILSKDIL
jgi:hypothetical protein